MRLGYIPKLLQPFCLFLYTLPSYPFFLIHIILLLRSITATMKWGIALASAILAATTTSALDVSDCACGFYDASDAQIWTDAIIVYFNETNTLPNDDFKALDFTHHREFGYNALYRQGATPQNVIIGNVQDENVNEQALQLWIDQGTGQHFVEGAGIESMRQDIQFGTFRSSMRGPPKNTG